MTTLKKVEEAAIRSQGGGRTDLGKVRVEIECYISCANNKVAEEEKKVAVIPFSNTLVQPNAVVVHAKDALFTEITVVRARYAGNTAKTAERTGDLCWGVEQLYPSVTAILDWCCCRWIGTGKIFFIQIVGEAWLNCEPLHDIERNIYKKVDVEEQS